MRGLGRRWYDQIKPWVGWVAAVTIALLELATIVIEKLAQLPPRP